MRRFYYHITEKRWGKSVTLKPRQHGQKRDHREPPVSRICVCDSVDGCFVSVYFWEMLPSIRLYVTEEPVFAVKPYNVSDSHITGEHWLLEPTTFRFVDEIGLDDKRVMRFIKEYHSSNLAFGDGEKKSESFQKRLRKFMKERLKGLYV